ALELVAAADRVAAAIPRGRRELADQLKRASTSTVLLIAEGANRRTAGDKRQRFAMARGECWGAPTGATRASWARRGQRSPRQRRSARQPPKSP
ncbi:MAG: four helix bundle protein, partial [bacterium]|nr:four helix bundle protein [bacterium]